MKDYIKNPNFYYILIPLIAIGWAFTAWAVIIPKAQEKSISAEKRHFQDKDIIMEILSIDRERIKEDIKGKSRDFDYTTVMDQFTKKHNITPSNYTLAGKKSVKKGSQRATGADVVINSIKIETLAKFMSDLLMEWPDLECDTLTIAKVKKEKNNWKATIKFTYYQNL